MRNVRSVEDFADKAKAAGRLLGFLGESSQTLANIPPGRLTPTPT